ncbi:hypothetical protein CR513_46472, partial [Mucuna pruriens]
MENEGHAVNIPHMFKGQNYNYWKQRMIEFFDACHIDIWSRNFKIIWNDELAYEDSKISMLGHRYELFKMEDHESIDQMFGTIINNLRSLGKT